MIRHRLQDKEWKLIATAFGPWQTLWHLFNQWNQNGTLNKVLNRLQLTQELDKELWCIDGTIIRAARCAGGGGKKTTRMSLPTTH